MKGLAILFILALVLFGGQAIYYSGKIDAAMGEAEAALPLDPDTAYLKMKPVFEYSNLTTFGKAASSKPRFFDRLADAYVQKFEHADNMQPDFFRGVSRAFSVMKDAEKDLKIDLDGQRLRVLEAARANYARLSGTLTLASWDAMLNMLKGAEKEGAPESYREQLAGWLPQARAVDRRPIGMRTGLAFAQEALGAGIRALALTPSEPGGPLIGALPKPVADRDLIEAERHFQSGEEFVLGLQRGFSEKDIPAELRGIYAKLLFNHAAMRIAHLVDAGPQASTAATFYLANLYSKSSGDDAEIYGAFVNTVNSQMTLATGILGRPGALPPEDAPTVEALALRAYAEFCQARGDRNGTQANAQAFQAVAARPGLPPRAAEDLKRMSSTDRGFLLLR